MPFVSQKQRAFMYAKHPSIAKRWEQHTPKNKKLPTRVEKKKDKSAQEKAAELAGFQSIGSGLLTTGQKFGGKRWVDRLNRLRERAIAGDESAQQLLSILGMSSMMLGAGLGAAAGRYVGHPGLGGAAGAALGAAPALVSGEKKTPVIVPGFTADTETEVKSSTNNFKMLHKEANGGVAETSQEEAEEVMDPDKATAIANFISARGDKGIDDEEVHDFSKSIGVEPGEAEEEIYRMLATLLKGRQNDVMPGGRAAGMPNEMFPKKQLRLGTKTEKEHTPSSAFAAEISKDHLTEGDDYYSRLAEMEKEMEAAKARGEIEGVGEERDGRKNAFKYGFFVKIAELGMTPSELTKLAVTGPLMAAGAVGKVGETASGLGRWSLEKLLSAIALAGKAPLITAPIAGMLLGGAYRALTAPEYETPEDLKTIERIALYRRLTREALKKARKKQEARLSLTGEKEKSLQVPVLEG